MINKQTRALGFAIAGTPGLLHGDVRLPVSVESESAPCFRYVPDRIERE